MRSKKVTQLFAGLLVTAMVVTGTVIPSTTAQAKAKSVTIKTQKQLDAALKDPKVTSITIKTSKGIDLKIKTGDYGKKNLVINAPKATVNNYGNFKKISIQDGKTVYDRGAANNIAVSDKNSLKLYAGKQSKDTDITITSKGSKITIVNNGSVDSINVKGKSSVTVGGSAKEAPTITNNASGSKIVTTMDAAVVLNKSASLTVKSGATLDSLTMKADATVTVSAGTTVNELIIDKADANVNLKINGTVGKVIVDQKATINVSGTTTDTITVENNASGSEINSAVKTDVSLNADAKISLEKGAEGSTVKAESADVKPTVENKTDEKVTITDSTGKDSTIDAGKTDADAKPSTGNTNQGSTSGGSTGGGSTGGDPYYPPSSGNNQGSNNTITANGNVTFTFPEGITSTSEGLSDDGAKRLDVWDFTNSGFAVSGTVSQAALEAKGEGAFPVFVKIPEKDVVGFAVYNVTGGNENCIFGYDPNYAGTPEYTKEQYEAACKGWVTKHTDGYYYFKFGNTFAKKTAGIWKKADNSTIRVDICKENASGEAYVAKTMTFTITNGITVTQPSTIVDGKVTLDFPSEITSSSTGLSDDEAKCLDAWTGLEATDLTITGAVSQETLNTKNEGAFPVFVKIPWDENSAGFEVYCNSATAPFTSYMSTNEQDKQDWKGWLATDENNAYFKFGNSFAEKNGGIWTKKATAVKDFTVNILEKDSNNQTYVAKTMSFTIDMSGITVGPATMSADGNVTFTFPEGIDSTSEGLSDDGEKRLNVWGFTNSGFAVSGTVSQADLEAKGEGAFPVFVKIPTQDVIGFAVYSNETCFTGYDSTVEESVNAYKGWVTKDSNGYTYFKFGYTFASKANGDWVKGADSTPIRVDIYKRDAAGNEYIEQTMSFTITNNITVSDSQS